MECPFQDCDDERDGLREMERHRHEEHDDIMPSFVEVEADD